MATTAHGIVYPDSYAGKADVPTVLAANATSIEAALVDQDNERANLIANMQGVPPGLVSAYAGNTAPTGWKVCDGTAHGSSSLAAIIGSANVPDLRDRFIVGVGPGYVKGATGGAALVTLTGAQSGLRAHGHGTVLSASENASHTHSGNTGAMSANATHTHTVSGSTDTEAAHTHQVQVNEGDPASTGDGNYIDTLPVSNGVDKTVGQTLGGGAHSHVVTATAASASTAHTHPFTSGGVSANHQHNVTIGTTTATPDDPTTQAHENRPPYYALVYIIKL